MSEAEGNDLTDYLEKHSSKGFSPVPQYFHDGDFISVYFKEDEAHSNRINEWLTIYHSIETNEIVGCKIKGVRRMFPHATADETKQRSDLLDAILRVITDGLPVDEPGKAVYLAAGKFLSTLVQAAMAGTDFAKVHAPVGASGGAGQESPPDAPDPK